MPLESPVRIIEFHGIDVDSLYNLAESLYDKTNGTPDNTTETSFEETYRVYQQILLNHGAVCRLEDIGEDIQSIVRYRHLRLSFSSSNPDSCMDVRLSKIMSNRLIQVCFQRPNTTKTRYLLMPHRFSILDHFTAHDDNKIKTVKISREDGLLFRLNSFGILTNALLDS